MNKNFILWSPLEEDKLIQLYQTYGKLYTRLCKDIEASFGDTGKFNINRINSKINTLMRQGLQVLITRTKEDWQFVKAVEQQSASRVVQKIISLPNTDFFSTKGKLIELKKYPDAPQYIIQQIKNLLLQIMDKSSSKKNDKEKPQKDLNKPNTKRKQNNSINKITPKQMEMHSKNLTKLNNSNTSKNIKNQPAFNPFQYQGYFENVADKKLTPQHIQQLTKYSYRQYPSSADYINPYFYMNPYQMSQFYRNGYGLNNSSNNNMNGMSMGSNFSNNSMQSMMYQIPSYNGVDSMSYNVNNYSKNVASGLINVDKQQPEVKNKIKQKLQEFIQNNKDNNQ